jgi:hypothetical protein
MSAEAQGAYSTHRICGETVNFFAVIWLAGFPALCISSTQVCGKIEMPSRACCVTIFGGIPGTF